MTADSLHILVTGGAGFVGSHLCDSLIQKGHRITCVDNLHSGSIDNVRPLFNHPRFTFIQHDVEVPLALRGPVDEIYHLACPASPRHYQSDPVKTVRTNVIGTLNILKLAREKGARILQASTSEVYGDPEVHPQDETYMGRVDPTGPRACYDEGKRCAETLFFDFRRMYGLDIKVVRIFNTYGPRMAENDGRVVSNFIVQALTNQPLTIYGDGSQTRSLCYVSDLVDALERMMESGEEVTGPVNLGNPQEIEIGELALRVLEVTGSRSELVYRDLPKDDPKLRRPAIGRANEQLGWLPRIDLSEGLQSTVDYFTLKLAEETRNTAIVANTGLGRPTLDVATH